MDSDKELLELAYKAAFSGADLSKDADMTKHWNPLTDNGDAFRLAVNFQMVLDIQSIAHMDWIENDDKSDPVAATRRAIVMAAAEIGRQGKD